MRVHHRLQTSGFERLAGRAQALVDTGRALGMSLAIVEGGEVTYAAGFGSTSVEPEGVPVTPTTLFAIASISKVILATLIMRLVERGVLDLDEPVVSYLPGFAFSDADLGRRVTLRHLLSHTSGLPAAGKNWGPCGPHALREFVYQQIPHYGFVAEPGRVYEYSNTAVCVAGHVAEAVTGGCYRDLVAEHALSPLGMSRTTYDHAVAMTFRLALPHEEQERNDSQDGHGGVGERPGWTSALRTVHRWPDNASGDPSGFAIAPTVDLAALAAMLLGRGRHQGKAFLTPESVAEMCRPHADRRVAAASHPVAHWTEGYGLGLMLGTYRGARLVQHGGLLQSFDNYFHLQPDTAGGVGFVLLTNAAEDGALAELVHEIHDTLLGLPPDDPPRRAVLVPPLAAAPDRDRWPRHEGTYLSARQGCLWTVRVRGGHLELVRDTQPRRLVPVAAGRYFFEEADEGGQVRVPVEFLPEADGSLPTQHLVVGGTPYRRLAADGHGATAPDTWVRFTGTFRDPSNRGEGAAWRFDLVDGTLRLTGDWADEPCAPLGPSSFLSSIGLLEFDAGGGAVRVGMATRYFRVEHE